MFEIDKKNTIGHRGHKIQIVSDIHLEFLKYECEIPVTDADVVVYAGDIGVGTRHMDWFKGELEKHQKPLIYVLGNHEFYYQNMMDIRSKWADFADEYPDFNLLDNGSTVVNGVIYIGGTMWTDLDGRNAMSEMAINESLNDFSCIRKSDNIESFRAMDSAIEFDNTMNYLRVIHEMIHEDDKVVMVTHHSPSHQSVAPQFRGSGINGAFASDLDGFIEFSKINLWIHGHMHNVSDYMIENTRIVANPKGYPNEGSYSNFRGNMRQWDGGKIVEI
jgi:Icc-related predicted phosphoesterase